jgi:hypothetical protein
MLIGWTVSPQQAAAAIMEDQKATHKRAGMTISPLRIGHCKHRKMNAAMQKQFRKLGRHKDA